MTQEQVDADSDINKKYDISYEMVIDNAPKGTIIKQSIKAGKTLKGEDNEIVLTVSLGPEGIPIPNLENYTEFAAREMLEDLGLVVKVEQKESGTVDEGYVIGVNKEIGVCVNPGETVILYVSTGKSTVIDDYSNRSIASVKESMKNSGINIKEVQFTLTGEDSYVQKDYIVKQEPKSGSTLKKGDTLTLYVSNGKINYTFDITLKNLPEDYESDDVTIKITEEDGTEIHSSDISLKEKKYSYTCELMKQVDDNNAETECVFKVYIIGKSGKKFEYANLTVDVKKNKITDSYVFSGYPKAETEEDNSEE